MQSHDPSGLLPSDFSLKKWLIPGIIVAIVAVGIVVGVVFTKQEADRQVSAASVPAAQVAVTAVGFDVSDLTIEVGQAVVWEGQDNAEHQLVLSSSSDKAAGFGSGVRFGFGQSYSFVFDTPGVYHYYDALNPLQFKGTITVVK